MLNGLFTKSETAGIPRCRLGIPAVSFVFFENAPQAASSLSLTMASSSAEKILSMFKMMMNWSPFLPMPSMKAVLIHIK